VIRARREFAINTIPRKRTRAPVCKVSQWLWLVLGAAFTRGKKIGWTIARFDPQRIGSDTVASTITTVYGRTLGVSLIKRQLSRRIVVLLRRDCRRPLARQEINRHYLRRISSRVKVENARAVWAQSIVKNLIMEGLPILNVRRSLSPHGRSSFPRWFTRKRFEYRGIKASKVVAFVISASRARSCPDEIGCARCDQMQLRFVKDLRNRLSAFYTLVLYMPNADIYYFRRVYFREYVAIRRASQCRATTWCWSARANANRGNKHGTPGPSAMNTRYHCRRKAEISCLLVPRDHHVRFRDDNNHPHLDFFARFRTVSANSWGLTKSNLRIFSTWLRETWCRRAFALSLSLVRFSLRRWAARSCDMECLKVAAETRCTPSGVVRYISRNTRCSSSTSSAIACVPHVRRHLTRFALQRDGSVPRRILHATRIPCFAKHPVKTERRVEKRD